jgi:nucleoid-associated protein EbfC
MFGKLNALKQQIEEIKSRLDTIAVEAEAGNNKVRVECSANRHIQNIFISQEWFKTCEREELEDLLVSAVNKALEKAKSVEETELRSVAGGMLPGMGF